MTPLHFMLQMSQTFAAATLKAQSAWWDASLAGADKLTRVHETPADAAGRARANADAGSARSWYRPPAATWSEISDKAAASNPAVAVLGASGFPGWFGSPFHGLSAFQNPFFGMMMTTPFSLPSLLGAMPGLSMNLPNGTTLRADYAAHTGETPADRQSAVAQPNQDRVPAEAVASITMPDNTIYKITIPMSGPIAFWPWASGFGAGVHASQPLTIEGSAKEADED